MKKLIAAREAKGMTRTELAVASGTTERSIYNYETGRSEPVASVAVRIADALGVDVSDIWKGEGR